MSFPVDLDFSVLNLNPSLYEWMDLSHTYIQAKDETTATSIINKIMKKNDSYQININEENNNTFTIRAYAPCQQANKTAFILKHHVWKTPQSSLDLKLKMKEE